MREILANSQSLKDIAGFKGGRSTGRTTGNRNVVDTHQERFAFDISEAHIEVVGQPVLNRAVDKDFVKLGFETGPKAVAELGQANRLFRHFFLGDFTGRTQTDNAGDVQRAGAHAAFVATAVNDGGKLNARIAAANVERADSLRSINLVRGNGQQVDVVFLHVDGNFADSLHAIGCEEDAVLLGDFADFLDRVNDANFVVGIHDGDQNCFRRDGFANVFWVHAAIFTHRKVGNFKAFFFQTLAGIENCLVLDSLGDDVIALFAVHFGDALDHQVVAFSGAAGEDDFLRSSANQRGDLRAGGFDRFFAGPAEGMVTAGGVAEFLGEIGQHGLNHARIDLRSGVIIEVNRQLYSHFPFSCRTTKLLRRPALVPAAHRTSAKW